MNIELSVAEQMVTAINLGKVDTELEEIINAAMTRQKEVGQERGRALSAGSKVRIINRPSIKPAYLRGVICTVKKVNITRVSASIDDEDLDGNPQHKGKYTSGITLPMDLIEVV